MNIKWKTWATLAIVLAWAGAASAGQIGLTFNSDSPTQICTMNPPPPGYTTSTQFYVGQSNFTVKPVQPADVFSGASAVLYSKALSNGGTLHGYCIDTYQTITNGWPDEWIVVDLASDPTGAATLAPYLGPNHYTTLGSDLAVAQQKVADLQALFYNHGLTTPTADQAAAMGAAVWEIVNETSGTYNLSLGSFTVTKKTGSTDWVATANGWLSPANLELPNGAIPPTLFALVDPVTQDFVIAFEGTGSTQTVPEPFTMLTACLTTCGLGFYIRRRSGKDLKKTA